MNIHPPQDLARDELMQLATETRQRYLGQGAVIHFKFTCEHCGERCTLQEPNVLYEFGECFQCGRETEITHGGFALALGYDSAEQGDVARPKKSWRESSNGSLPSISVTPTPRRTMVSMGLVCGGC